MASTLKHARVLVTGLGRSGERIPLIEWLLSRGAHVTVADTRTAESCAPLVRRLHERMKKSARDGKEYQNLQARCVWSFGVGAPTQKRGLVVRTAADEVRLFYAHRKGPVVAVTGAHGKTTAAVWAAHLIGNAIAAGYTPDRSLFSVVDQRGKVVVAELPPVVADACPSRATIIRVGASGDLAGYDEEAFVMRWGRHNLAAGYAAVAAARAAGVSDARIAARLKALPEVSHRQEVLYRSARRIVVNDTAATTPERGVAAVERWGGPTTILIAGGEQCRAGYAAWAAAVRANIRKTNIILLTGAATRDMRAALGSWGVGVRAYDSLAAAYAAAQRRAGVYVASVVLFSPAAGIGEAFADVRERGQQFSALVEERS